MPGTCNFSPGYPGADMTLHKLTYALGQGLFRAVARTWPVKFIDHIKPVKGDIDLLFVR